MKAVRLHKTGGPEVLQIDEVPMPEAGPGQVLVKAHSIGALVSPTSLSVLDVIPGCHHCPPFQVSR